MLYFIAIILISLTQAQYGYEYLAEWQTGVDKTINKQAEFTNPKFPIRQYTRVVFPRRFSDRPKVLLMHEEIQWSKGRNINYQTYVSDITINGFYINYVIQGPATVPILTVRWVAIVDPNAEIQYVHYQSDDLYYLRQGFGFRAQDFMISYYPRYPAPKVTAFIVGADFEIFDSIYTSIAIQMDIPNTSSMNVRFSTRDFCHVRSLLIAYFITNNHLTLAGSVASQHNFYNQFLDNSNKNTIRVQKFTRLVPSIYSIEPAYNILAQGISGFDVSSHYSSTYLRVTAEYMSQYSSAYTLLYGTRGETLMSYMQASYVLHPPGLPYHYYYKNYDWVVTKGDQIVIEETVAQEQKISDSKLTSAIKNVILANKNVEIMKENLQEDVREINVSVFDQVGQENQDIKYLDLFIHLTEQCLNNPNKSATLCTDLILKISYVISDPTKWSKHFNSKIQFQKNQIHEKINQFLSNCILLVENQKPVQKIIIMALTNLVSINEPEDETLCESCLKTLKILYKNNPDLKQLLKKTIQKNILTNLEQQNFLNIPICLLKGLTEFATEIKLGDWMTDQQCILFGRWLEQIFVIFKDDKQKIDQSVECTLQLMSTCFIAESFAIQLEEFITMEGVMDILGFCFQTKKSKIDDNFLKNKIIVYVFEMISSVNRFLKKSNPTIKEKYSEKISSEISKMIEELQSKNYHYAYSDLVQNQEQCQIMNKKLGSLIRTYGKILVDNPAYTKIMTDKEISDPVKKKERELLASQTEKKDEKNEDKVIFYQVLRLLMIKKLDPYIYGSLCQFLVVLMESSVIEIYHSSIISNIDNFNPILTIISDKSYRDFLSMARVYGQIVIPQHHTLSYMPTVELQYAVKQILKVFECMQKKALDPNDILKFKEKIKYLEQNNYKHIILLCLESPIEEIRIIASFLLSNIGSKKWEFEDLKTMQRILEKLQGFLTEGFGEEEISCLLMIFCNLVASIDNPVSIQFRCSAASQNLCIVTYKILRTNMSRDTRGDEAQTRQKIALSASCVFLLNQYLFSADLRNNLFNQRALFEIGEALRLEDAFVTDVKSPLSIESVCLVIQPLYQAIEDNVASINVTHLNFFRVLMQISNILNFQFYSMAQAETEVRNKQEKKIMQQKEQQQNQGARERKAQKLNDSFEEINQSSEDIINGFKKQLYTQCCEQWDTWKLQKFPNYKSLELIDDLLSAFEVQHTIFSSQNGVDRLLICLQPLIQHIKLDLDERTISLDSLYQQEGIEYQSKVVTSSLSKHAIVSKLVGYNNNPDIDITRWSSQFFEVVQEKKILANALVDLCSFTEEQFFDYMATHSSQKAKIALVTSAFLYSCYISIIFAPEASILCNALTEIQQKEKLLGYIKLCAASDWYNAFVSIKLLKIYRLVGRHMIYYFNTDNTFNFQKYIQEEAIRQVRASNELPVNQDVKLSAIKKIIKEIELKQAQKRKPLFQTPKPEELLENCHLINKTILIIISDFKEIIQSLNKHQLLQQLKLVNCILKTIQMVFKQLLIAAVEIKIDEYPQIFSSLRKLHKLIGVDGFFDQLTQCMQKLDKKLSSLQLTQQNSDDNQKQQYQLYKNLAQVLGLLFIKKGQNLKQLFGNLCQRFDSSKLSETVNAGIKVWVAQMVLLHQFTYKDIYNPFVNQIPVYETVIDFKKTDGYTKQKNCLLLLFNTYFIVVEITGIQVNQEYLQTKITSKNYKIHMYVQGQQIRECVCISQQQMSQMPQMTEQQKQEMQENQEELNEGLRTMDLQIMNLDGGSKKSDIDYLFYFETKWDCAKYVKLMNILQNADMSNDTPLL